ncbi:MAG: FkbM family methyltransferase [Gemmatimonadota bacterium]
MATGSQIPTDEMVPWPDAGMARAFALLEPLQVAQPVVIDVGAHNGETLQIAARRLAAGATYVALEPNPGTFALLTKAAAAYDGTTMRATCLQAAAGPSEGTVQFNATRASAVAGVLAPVAGLGERVPSGDHDILEQVTVPMVTIDGLIARHGLGTVDLLKVDAEGYDLEVLRGAAAALAAHRVRVVLTEVFFVSYREGQAYFWDIASFLHDAGYRFVNLYDTRDTSQGRLYTGNGLWVSPEVAGANGYL